jgi:hypothetical protein
MGFGMTEDLTAAKDRKAVLDIIKTVSRRYVAATGELWGSGKSIR